MLFLVGILLSSYYGINTASVSFFSMSENINILRYLLKLLFYSNNKNTK